MYDPFHVRRLRDDDDWSAENPEFIVPFVLVRPSFQLLNELRHKAEQTAKSAYFRRIPPLPAAQQNRAESRGGLPSLPTLSFSYFPQISSGNRSSDHHR